MATDQEKIVQRLQTYFSAKPEVVLAFLFGSRSAGRASARSDWDIGVYLDGENETLAEEIRRETEKIIGAESDVIIINRASATLSWRILSSGQPLIIKNRSRYWQLLSSIGDETQDYYETARDYYQIFQRSASLLPGDRTRLEQLIEFLEAEMTDYPRFQKLSRDDYLTNRDVKRNVEHWIEHLVHGAVDVAKIILASERQPIPETYKDIVERLSTIPPFAEEKIGDQLASWVKLRNLIAHEYLENRWRQISQFLAQTEPLWQKLIAGTKKFLEQSSD